MAPAALCSRPTQQFALTVVATIVKSRLEELRRVLMRVDAETVAGMRGRPLGGTQLVPFEAITTLHYARWVILEPSAQLRQGPLLVLSTNYDGILETQCCESRAQARHLAEFVAEARHGLDAIYDCCSGYPGSAASSASIQRFLREHIQATQTFYVGSRGRSRDQIRAEAQLRRRIEKLLDDKQRAGALPREPVAIHQLVRSEIGPVPPFPPQPDRRSEMMIARAQVMTLAVAFLPLTLAMCALVAWKLRKKEQFDESYQPQWGARAREGVRRLAARENLFYQNQLTKVVRLKSGPIRRYLAEVVLWWVNMLAACLFNQGKLGEIPSIHMARWVLLDGGRSMLFLSNFDGSWESYLGDFVDKAGNWLTAVWSNTQGYPRTRWLIYAGSDDEDRFKAWARSLQVETQVWYSAYPNLSIVNINDNTEIRRGLADPAALAPRIWLQMLG